MTRCRSLLGLGLLLLAGWLPTPASLAKEIRIEPPRPRVGQPVEITTGTAGEVVLEVTSWPGSAIAEVERLTAPVADGQGGGDRRFRWRPRRAGLVRLRLLDRADGPALAQLDTAVVVDRRPLSAVVVLSAVAGCFALGLWLALRRRS